MSNRVIESDGKFYYQITSPFSLGNGTLVDEKEPVRSPVNQSWYVSDTLPVTVTSVKNNREYTDWTIKSEYSHLNLPVTVEKFEYNEDDELPSESMFYTRNFVEKEVRETKEIEWEVNIKENFEAPVIFTAVGERSWGNDKLIQISPSSSLVDSLVFPDLVLPAKACALTGDQLYKIIRYHVKQNIDGRYAKITSDYDFCFTVKKQLAITPQSHTYDARTGRQRTPRYKTYTVTDREADVFEMTSPSQKYKGYTVLPGISAKSHAELKKKLDKMLNELMETINEPLASCKECEGTGVVPPTKVEYGKS